MIVSPVDVATFRRILARNVALPLGIGVFSAALFLFVVWMNLAALQAVERSERVIGQANTASRLAVDMEGSMRGFVITGDEQFLQPFSLARPRMFPDLDALAQLVQDDAAQVRRVRHIRAAVQQWIAVADDVVAARRKGGDFLTPIKEGRGKIYLDQVRDAFNDLIDAEERRRDARAVSARHAAAVGVGVYLLFSLGVAGLLAYFGRRELTRLADTYTGALARQGEHNDYLQRQAWLRTGQGELAVHTRGHDSLTTLGQAGLDYLVAYAGAAVGALYSRDDDGSLRRVAAYGMDHRAAPEVFRARESLVGQAAHENRMLRLDEVSPDYIRVSSALGSAAPRHLIIVPLTHEGHVQGVLEVGFVQVPDASRAEFLESVSATLGAALAAGQYRRRLQQALVHTQQLNEELQVQQEELRTANEELEEQSRVLEEAQSHLENQQAELEQTNEQLAEQTQMLEVRNEALNGAQRELEARAADLERASQYKSEFLANMSHELRTPLNSSLILARLLADNAAGNLDEEQVRFAQTIYSAGNDLLNLINDILDIAKVEAGKLELDPEQLPLRRSLDSLRQIFEPLARNKQLELTIAVDDEVPPTLFTDRQRFEQILRNLLSNALKFTDRGAVSLQVGASPDGRLRFAVRDTGIGIAPDQQEAVFEAFRQADGTTSRRYGGTGLGLSISRDLARLLGGSIEVDSVVGAGSTFTLVLPQNWSGSACAPTPRADAPAHAPADAPAPKPAPSAGAPAAPVAPPFPDDRGRRTPGTRTVLVVEDDPQFARILFDLAHEMGYRCVVAPVAADGLALAAAEEPDAILLDVRLPDRSGLSVLEQLKDNPATRHIPVHIVSASDDPGTALHLGAIGYARKPTTRAELEQVFRKLEEKFTQTIKRILLVEDDPRQRDSVVHLIADADIEITPVASGGEALALLRTTIFDCMIIDLKLPDMQGDELLQRMAQEEICSFPPVIVYTGRNLTREEEANLLQYSRSIIIKGARSPERLLDEVTLFLHKVEAQLSSERQTMLQAVRSRDRVFEGRTVLLVDDDVRNVFALTSALEQKGLRVEVGRNGIEALAKLDTLPAIDLVLMDVMMPEMDGMEAMRRIRADKRFARLPVIAITAKATRTDQEACLAAGANDYLAKPLDLSRLYSLLRVWMPNLERL